MTRTRILSRVTIASAALALASAAVAACSTPVTVPCCALSIHEMKCRQCANDPNCCDIFTSSGNVQHHLNGGPPGAEGNDRLQDGQSCTCRNQRRTCSQGGYRVNVWDPIDEVIVPNHPGGGSPCQVPGR